VPIWGLTRLTASFGLGFVGFERGDRLSLRDYSTLMGPTSAFPERRWKSQFRRRGMPNQQPRPRSSPSPLCLRFFQPPSWVATLPFGDPPFPPASQRAARPRTWRNVFPSSRRRWRHPPSNDPTTSPTLPWISE
jgi:hypothetical protein